MHALTAHQGREQKRKACINFTQMNLFSKWYCNGNTLPHNWNLWTSYVIILLQCNCSCVSRVLFFLFITTINSPSLYAMWLIYVPFKMYQLKKIVWSFPLIIMLKLRILITIMMIMKVATCKTVEDLIIIMIMMMIVMVIVTTIVFIMLYNVEAHDNNAD